MDYNVEERKAEYKKAGVAEEDIELVFAPIQRYIQDRFLSEKARKAHDKYLTFIGQENEKWQEANKDWREKLLGARFVDA